MAMNFDDIDFKGGRCRYVEPLGEDMIEVCYPNGFMIDAGYLEESGTFYINVIKNNDWVNIYKELPAKTEIELKNTLRYAIDYVTHQ